MIPRLVDNDFFVFRLLQLGWGRLIQEDMKDLDIELATFDNLSAHVTKANMELFKSLGIHVMLGPPNGTDLWQPNDQLVNRHLRRELRKLLTRRAMTLAQQGKLAADGKIPRPTNGEFVMLLARAIQAVNKLESVRKDHVTGETIRTSVVRRSWELAGWIKGKPYSRKLKDIMSKDFAHIDPEPAMERIYRNTRAVRPPPASPEPQVSIQKDCTVFGFFMFSGLHTLLDIFVHYKSE